MTLMRFFDGTTFFVGLALCVTGSLSLFWLAHRHLRRWVVAASVIGVVLVLLSAVPLPLWAYAIWVLAAAETLVQGGQRSPVRTSKRRWAGAILLLLTTAWFCVAEVPHHLSPRIPVPKEGTVFVIGDSLSAGIGRKERCWPEVLGGLSGLPVVNLAMGGATAQTAASQVAGVDRPGSVVILEIGGNDLLGSTSAEDFRRHLEVLLSELRSQGHRVFMFELPLYPFRNAFGAAQRELAERYGVALIPKRYLSSVIGMDGGTLDGLHFSQKGHDAMARALAETLDVTDAP